MLTPLDLQRLAVRVEGLMHQHTHGWHPADELDLRNRLPGGRDPRALPTPEALREMARTGQMPDYEKYRLWISTALTLEGHVRDNDPRNPKRIMRDMARGRWPHR